MFLRNIKNKFLYNFLFALRMDECTRVPYAVCCMLYAIQHFRCFLIRWNGNVQGGVCTLCATPKFHWTKRNKKESKHLVIPIFQRITYYEHFHDWNVFGLSKQIKLMLYASHIRI